MEAIAIINDEICILDELHCSRECKSKDPFSDQTLIDVEMKVKGLSKSVLEYPTQTIIIVFQDKKMFLDAFIVHEEQQEYENMTITGAAMDIIVDKT